MIIADVLSANSTALYISVEKASILFFVNTNSIDLLSLPTFVIRQGFLKSHSADR